MSDTLILYTRDGLLDVVDGIAGFARSGGPLEGLWRVKGNVPAVEARISNDALSAPSSSRTFERMCLAMKKATSQEFERTASAFLKYCDTHFLLRGLYRHG